MERVDTTLGQENIATALRQMPLFAGVPEEALDKIADAVSSTTQVQVQSSLRKVQLFEGLEDEDLERIQEISSTVMVGEGEFLFEEGDEGETFYIVLRGAIELTKGTEKLAVMKDGDYFGEMSLLNSTPRSASARALESTSLLEIDQEHFEEILGSDTLAYRVLKGLSKALWATSVRFTATKRQANPEPQIVVREVSRLIQQKLLPSGIPQSEEFEVAANTATGSEGSGRSIWDWFVLGDDRLVFAVLRTMDEGLPPAHSLAVIRALLREIAGEQADLGSLLRRVNAAIAASQPKGAAQHVECGLMALDTGQLEWANAGKLAGGIARAAGSVDSLASEAPAIGVEEDFDYRFQTFELASGDCIALFSEGAGVAVDETLKLLIAGRDKGVGEILPRLRTQLEDSGDIETDEGTLILIRSHSATSSDARSLDEADAEAPAESEELEPAVAAHESEPAAEEAEAPAESDPDAAEGEATVEAEAAAEGEEGPPEMEAAGESDGWEDVLADALEEEPVVEWEAASEDGADEAPKKENGNGSADSPPPDADFGGAYSTPN